MRLVLEYDTGDYPSCFTSSPFEYESKEKLLEDIQRLAEAYMEMDVLRQADYDAMNHKYPLHTLNPSKELQEARKAESMNIYNRYKHQNFELISPKGSMNVNTFIRDNKLELPKVYTVDEWFGDVPCD